MSTYLNQEKDNRIEFDHDNNLPEIFNGDLATFRLALHTLSEFSVKYCTEGKIELKTMFGGKAKDNNFLIKILFAMPLNKKLDKELLIQLLNESDQQGQDVDRFTKSDFTKRFKYLYEPIMEFGIGFILLPNIVKTLNGSVGVRCFTRAPPLGRRLKQNKLISKESIKNETLEISLEIPLACGIGDQRKIKSPY